MNRFDNHLRLNESHLNVLRETGKYPKLQTGSLDGAEVKIRSVEEDIDEKLEVEFLRRQFGLDAPNLNLSQSKIDFQRREKADILTNLELHQYLKTLGSSKASANLAQDILRNLLQDKPLPQPGKSLLEIANFHAALQRIYAALQNSDDDFFKWMSPLKFETPDLSALANKLQAAGDDTVRIHSLLEDFRGLSDDKEEIAKQFGTARFNFTQLKKKLSDSQNLPTLDEKTKELIKEKVEDEINELQISHGSHLHALKNLLEKSGGFAEKEIVETYDELLHSDQMGFAETAEALLERHSEDVLLESIIPLFEKALSHELQLSEDCRSVDKEKLYVTLSEIQNMHMLKTIIEKIDAFLSSLGRLHGIIYR